MSQVETRVWNLAELCLSQREDKFRARDYLLALFAAVLHCVIPG
jgi:hypothetical protein